MRNRNSLAIFAILLLAFAGMTSCKKTNTDPPVNPPPTPTVSLLQNKWTMDSVVSTITYFGQTFNQVDTYSTGDFIHFFNDSLVATNEDGYIDTSRYKNLNDQKIVLDGDTADIVTLTTTNFVASFDQSIDTAGITVNVLSKLYTHR